MTLTDPTETDILFHRACVTDLISFGTLIEIAAREHPPMDLDSHGIRLDIIEAILKDLRNTFDEWHGQVPEARIENLRERIFNATPELNFEAPRN